MRITAAVMEKDGRQAYVSDPDDGDRQARLGAQLVEDGAGVRFYDFSQINQAIDDSDKGLTVKPIVRIHPASA